LKLGVGDLSAVHELSITQGILDIVLAAAIREGGGRVTAIDLVIGELASIVDDSVQFYWDIIAEGTPAAGAKLRFRRVPLRFECIGCQATFEPADGTFACPHCASVSVRVNAGDDLRIDGFDLEPEPEDAPPDDKPDEKECQP